MHAHVGFMAQGQINVRFADGCVVEYKAPQFVSVEPGHEGWVVGDTPAVLIEFDFERRNRGEARRVSHPSAHRVNFHVSKNNKPSTPSCNQHDRSNRPSEGQPCGSH